jgi:hypothetical protein
MSKSCGDVEGKVFSVTPCAGGWRAIFRKGEGVTFRAELVVCWLLVQHGNDVPHLHPAVPMGSVVEDATLADNYVGVVDVDASDDAIRDMIKAIDKADKASKRSV